jgi:hypothetical protein
MGITETLKGELLAVARTYAAAKNIKLSSLGQQIFNSTYFFSRLEGGELKLMCEAYDNVMQWMSNRWPEGARWPPHVQRPAPEVVAPEPKREKAVTMEKVKTKRKGKTA